MGRDCCGSNHNSGCSEQQLRWRQVIWGWWSDYSSSESFDDYSADDDDDDDYADSSNSRDYPDERSSSREHDVSGYDRQQNGKTVHVNPYKRGGRHDDDQS